jgi:L-fucose mutarotase
MLRTRILHPEILDALGRAGHGSKVLVADGNYPFATTLGPNARLVCLNLAPGLIGANAVLEVLLSAIPVEAAAVMQYATRGAHALDDEPPVWEEFRRTLREHGMNARLDLLERAAFYAAARSPDVALTIATGEQAIYANVLLTIGVVRSDQ